MVQCLSELAEDEAPEAVRLQKAVDYLHSTLQLELGLHQYDKIAAQQIPVFLGHGVLDPQVLVDLGRQAHRLLSFIGLNVQWREYDSLGHWYSAPMLGDIIEFLESILVNEKR